VLPGRVMLCDFKSGRAAPADPAQVPVLYLRQMAAYRALLRGLYPTHDIECLLVWTEGPSVMTLTAALLDMHRPGVRPVLEDGRPP
jgi:ATP-dependent helicase/nuclease subunit A